MPAGYGDPCPCFACCRDVHILKAFPAYDMVGFWCNNSGAQPLEQQQEPVMAEDIHRLDSGLISAVCAPAEVALPHLQPNVPRLPVLHIPHRVVCPAAQGEKCAQTSAQKILCCAMLAQLRFPGTGPHLPGLMLALLR